MGKNITEKEKKKAHKIAEEFIDFLNKHFEEKYNSRYYIRMQEEIVDNKAKNLNYVIYIYDKFNTFNVTYSYFCISVDVIRSEHDDDIEDRFDAVQYTFDTYDCIKSFIQYCTYGKVPNNPSSMRNLPDTILNNIIDESKSINISKNDIISIKNVFDNFNYDKNFIFNRESYNNGIYNGYVTQNMFSYIKYLNNKYCKNYKKIVLFDNDNTFIGYLFLDSNDNDLFYFHFVSDKCEKVLATSFIPNYKKYIDKEKFLCWLILNN